MLQYQAILQFNESLSGLTRLYSNIDVDVVKSICCILKRFTISLYTDKTVQDFEVKTDLS